MVSRMPQVIASTTITQARKSGHPTERGDFSFEAAETLQRTLAAFHIRTDVNAGKGVALVSVWADLIVWTDGELGYWWWSGRYSSPGRKLYAWGPVRDPVSVARRVACRFAETFHGHPHSAAILRMLSTVRDGWELPPTLSATVPGNQGVAGPA
ncbi:hypothetical protein DQ384_03665 [Sphaerisporangium album]|uniref:Uncharacterized protein n=1 Tax=Sphaerisporangium album TaxID=509200 RepID=A0A367FQP7_9ACTN|nr:hypothetical protein [Sphaerisporangium album]RCG32601.1 hypothetical protein DQ384_03665 [Sphaerisporangium album]